MQILQKTISHAITADTTAGEALPSHTEGGGRVPFEALLINRTGNSGPINIKAGGGSYLPIAAGAGISFGLRDLADVTVYATTAADVLDVLISVEG